jgi:hypothetical protein
MQKRIQLSSSNTNRGEILIFERIEPESKAFIEVSKFHRKICSFYRRKSLDRKLLGSQDQIRAAQETRRFFFFVQPPSVETNMAGSGSSSEREIVKIALLSRAFLLLLILLWRLLGRPYDTSASLDPPCLSSHHLQQDLSAEPAWGGAESGDSALWSRLGRMIEGSIVWDSVYFVRIAQCSYEYEQTFAFLPVFPLALRLIAKTGAWYIVK